MVGGSAFRVKRQVAGPELSVCEDRRQEATEATVWGAERSRRAKRGLKRLAATGFHSVSEDMVRRLHLISRALENHGRFSVQK